MISLRQTWRLILKREACGKSQMASMSLPSINKKKTPFQIGVFVLCLYIME